ncbi:MAG TPA: hypothetical protein VFS40_14155 [Gemmatimonadales bacterium]|nr:hypothetical protein [Gemmatimonadales bacterium]
MKRALALLALSLALGGCPSYDRTARLTQQDGYVPTDVFARYGKEQAQAMALAREYGYALKGAGESVEGRIRAADSAMAYAKRLPDVVTVTPDTLATRLTISFRSGWRTMVVPIEDGKRGSETPNLPAGAGAPAKS